MSDDYKDPRWQKLRLKIMERDGFACVACLDATSTLHVHHMKYHKYLWTTPAEWLQTLCESCHSALGRHPKAGISWMRLEHGPVISIDHCPCCSHPWVFADESGLRCEQCDWTQSTAFNVLFSTLDYRRGTGGVA